MLLPSYVEKRSAGLTFIHIIIFLLTQVKFHLYIKNKLSCLIMKTQPPAGWYIIITVVGVYEHFAAS